MHTAVTALSLIANPGGNPLGAQLQLHWTLWRAAVWGPAPAPALHGTAPGQPPALRPSLLHMTAAAETAMAPRLLIGRDVLPTRVTFAESEKPWRRLRCLLEAYTRLGNVMVREGGGGGKAHLTVTKVSPIVPEGAPVQCTAGDAWRPVQLPAIFILAALLRGRL